MANRIVQAVYDLQDKISGKLKSIGEALKGHKADSDKVTAGVEKNNQRLSASYAKSADGIGKLKAALVAVAAFVGLDKIKEGILGIVEAGEHIDDLQKQFATAFGGLDAGADQLQKVRDFAKTVPQPFEDIAQAAIKLKRAGFDPLDGTLQALVDNNNALNGSQETLLATIDALGKANVKGAINIRALVSLTEQGVPVFDLLGKAMGISSDRVRELATNGQLGSDSIKLLVTELGKLRAGAAADELGDTDSQLTKLKDTAKEFLESIAQSGVLDVFRAELKELNAQVEEAAKSGRLKEIAQSISDGIVATASAIKSAVGFVFDYSGALVELGKVYLTFRAINIAGSVLAGSAALLESAKSAAKAATQANATAGIFGKLGAAAKSIPRNIAIGVAAAGIEFTLTQLANLVAARKEEVETERKLKEGEADRDATLSKLADRIAAVKAQYQQYADTALQSGDALKEQNAEQLQAYSDQLDGAKRFYQALVVEARTAGDAAGLAGAKEKLADVNAEIALVNAQLAATSTVGADAAKGLTAGAAKIAAQLGQAAGDIKSIGTAIAKAFEGFDLSKDIVQVGDFAQGFDAVAAKGGKAGKVLDDTLLKSLKELSGEDLLKFQSAAIAAIDSVGDAGEKNSATLKATLETALDRLGVKAQDTGAKITKSGTDTIATFTAVAENVQADAKTIAAAFDAALGNTKTVEEAKALGAALQAAAATGKVGLKELADAGRDLDERIRSITASVSPLASQFDLLGIKSQAQLVAMRDNAKEAFDAIVQGSRDGTAAQEDVVRAFKAYVDAARAASADSSAASKAQVEDQLSVLASVLNLGDAFVKAGDAGKSAGDRAADGFGNARDTIDEAGQAVKDFGTDAAAAAIAQDRIGESAKNNATAIGSVIALTIDQQAALHEMNAELEKNGSLENISLDSAKNILQQIGGLIGVQAQVLAERIGQLEAIAQQAEETAQRMKDEAADLQDQIDQLQGNDLDIEDRRHQQKLADLEAEAEADGALNTAAYANLVELENKLHALKLKNLRDEGKTSASGGGSIDGGNGAGDSAPSGDAPDTGGGNANNTQTNAPPGQPSAPPNINISVTGFLPSDSASLDSFARRIGKELQRIGGLTF